MSNAAGMRNPFQANLAATDWMLRAAVAIVFVLVGMEKFSEPSWVKLFADIGIGQWFRYFTGVMQVSGGVLLVVPASARLGMGLLASTMMGAMFVHLFVLGTGIGAAIIPAFLLGAVLAAGWKGRGEASSGKGPLALQ